MSHHISLNEMGGVRVLSIKYSKTSSIFPCHTVFRGVTLKCYKVATDVNRAEESEEGKLQIALSNLNYTSELSA